MEIIEPDDWHHHFRDGDALRSTVPYACAQFARAIAMPNLVPPVTTTEMALAYRDRILAHVPDDYKGKFQPLMTLYLTDHSTPEEIYKAKESGHVYAVKLYPKGATTNSHGGVSDIENVIPTLQAMDKVRTKIFSAIEKISMHPFHEGHLHTHVCQRLECLCWCMGRSQTRILISSTANR
jgi:dihydroorotase